MFFRTRKIGNHSYRYEEHRWREGKKVRSKSICRGRDDGGSGNIDVNIDGGRSDGGGSSGAEPFRKRETDWIHPGDDRQHLWMPQVEADMKAHKAAKAAPPAPAPVAVEARAPEAEKSAPEVEAPDADKT